MVNKPCSSATRPLSNFKPAKYLVRVTQREKRACKACEEQGVQSAPLPARVIDKGLASGRVVIDTVVSKYADRVPLYRQSAILERETGIEMPRATLNGWVMRVGELLRPITMDELFAIDEKARKENLTPGDRHPLRLEKAEPLLEQIKTAVQTARGDALPKSALA